MHAVTKTIALAALAITFATNDANAQSINWAWEYDYQVWAAEPVPELAYQVDYRNSNGSWSVFGTYETRLDAEYWWLRLDNWGYEADIDVIFPEPQYELFGTFDTYSQASAAANDLEDELGLWTSIISIRVYRDHNQVNPGSLIEVPGSNFREPVLPYPFKGY